jgi:hypothetical protein
MEEDSNILVEEVEMENEHWGSFSHYISDNDDDGLNLQDDTIGKNVIVDTTSVPATVKVVVDAEKVPCKRTPRMKTSVVWKDFTEVINGGVRKNQCNWCKSLFCVNSSSTTSQLIRHLRTCRRI